MSVSAVNDAFALTNNNPLDSDNEVKTTRPKEIQIVRCARLRAIDRSRSKSE